MQITNRTSDAATLAEIGRRLKRHRLDRNLSQQQLADEAGVSRGTVSRIEDGESAQLGSVLRIVRVLGLLGAIEQFISEPGPSPVEQVRRHGHQRQRATGLRTSRPRVRERGPWRWGDELAQLEE
jgi:transcriptional regulator with XRE-family HTH domain